MDNREEDSMARKFSLEKRCVLCGFKSEEIHKSFTTLPTKPDAHVCWPCAGALGRKFDQHQIELEEQRKEAEGRQTQVVYVGGTPQSRGYL